MAFAATVQQEARAADRHATDLDGTLRDTDRQPVDVTVHDLSAYGLRLTTPTPLAPGVTVTLGLPGLGVRGATIVWADGQAYGCRFLERLSEEELSRTLSAVVTAPVSITPATRDTLLLDTETPPVELYSPRLRVLAIGMAVVTGWSVILSTRYLLG